MSQLCQLAFRASCLKLTSLVQDYWQFWSPKSGYVPEIGPEHGEKRTVMIDATYLKAHRTASSLGVKKGGVDA